MIFILVLTLSGHSILTSRRVKGNSWGINRRALRIKSSVIFEKE